MRQQVIRFATIGVASTLVHLGLFWLFRQWISAQPANAVALVLATIFNTTANRHWTFSVRAREGFLKHQIQGLIVFGITLGATSIGLWVTHVVAPNAPKVVELVVITVTTAISTAVRFVALRWMFRDHN